MAVSLRFKGKRNRRANNKPSTLDLDSPSNFMENAYRRAGISVAEVATG
jgi:hypothetical protein